MGATRLIYDSEPFIALSGFCSITIRLTKPCWLSHSGRGLSLANTGKWAITSQALTGNEVSRVNHDA